MTNITKISSSKLPTDFGDFQIHIYRDNRSQVEHAALVMGKPSNQQHVLTRVHSECLTGDAFSSSRCDCGEQLKFAQQAIASKKEGIIIYLRDHEGRGIGLANKISAYALQDGGLDTVEANLALGLPVDQRTFEIAADILKHLEVFSINLLSNNPEKYHALKGLGVNVTQISPISILPKAQNLKYIETKRTKLGHFNTANI
jgi:GTP cyclohydrolase II